MKKLTRIENGLYCFLVTFDPTREVVNVVGLNAVGASSATSKMPSDSEEPPLSQSGQSIANSVTVDAPSVSPAEQPAQTTEELNAQSTEPSAVEPTRTSEPEVMKKALPPRREYRPNDLLTRKEAAEYLGVADRTLAIWKCTGRYDLPYVKIGRLVKYKKADLDKFIEYMKHESIAWKKKER